MSFVHLSLRLVLVGCQFGFAEVFFFAAIVV